MDEQTWRLVKEVFELCLSTDADQREQLLATQTLPPEALAEVRRLLAHHQSTSEEFLKPVHSVRAFLKPEKLFKEGELVGGRFSILRFLGSGGMGEVYAALDQERKEEVALKIIRRDAELSAESDSRFLREWRIASGVSHPNICKLFGLHTHQFAERQASFFSMELVKGKTLRELLMEKGRLSIDCATAVAKQILAGLHAVHSSGVVHRDLKPSNIMLADEPSSGESSSRVILMDFGLARHNNSHPSEELTASGIILGTLNYLSPEQLQGKPATLKSDLYAFGLIAFEMLTAGWPFAGDGPEAVLLRLRKRAPSLSRRDLPKEWVRVVEACLQKNPEHRPKSAEQVLNVLTKQMGFPIAYQAHVHRRAILLMAGAAALGAGAYEFWPRRLSANGEVTILTADAKGGDPVNHDPITFQLQRVLSQSPYINLWDANQLDEVWKRMQRAGPPAPSERDWREIAFREHVRLALFTKVEQKGTATRIEVGLQEIGDNPDYPKHSLQKQFESPDSSKLLGVIDNAAKWVRSVIGETSDEVASNSYPPELVTTLSWRALVDFTKGERATSASDYDSALFNYGDALRLDSGFTMAWMRKGDVQLRIGNEREAFAAYSNALESSKTRPLSRREDLRFRSMLASDSADYAEAEKLCAEYFHDFPKDSYGPLVRSFALLWLGYPEEAIQALNTVLTFEDRRGRAHIHLVWAYLYTGDRARAQSHVQALRAAGFSSLAAWAQASVAHMQGDTQAALHHLDELARDPGLIPDSLRRLYRCCVLADGGDEDKALEESLANAKRDSSIRTQVYWAENLISAAVLLCDRGQQPKAIELLKPLDPQSLGPHHLAQLGTLYARAGLTGRTRAILDFLPPSSPYPLFSIARLRLQGELESAQANHTPALKWMRQATALDVRAHGKEYLAYVLLRAGQVKEAKAEYEACKKQKSFQLRITVPEPAGHWARAARTVDRIANKQIV